MVPSQSVTIQPITVSESLNDSREPPFSTIYFDFDKSNLRPDQMNSINGNAQILLNNMEMRVLLEGHCDERGTVEYNLALGQRRADTVRTYLLDYGIDPSRIMTLSYGEEKPVESGHDEAAWMKNRRCEFTVSQ